MSNQIIAARFYSHNGMNSINPAPPLLPPILNNKIIKNPLKKEPMQTPTQVHSVFVPAFTRVNYQDQVKKELPSSHTVKVPMITKGHFNMNMLRIRRRKMKKHQLRKFRKRMLSYLLRVRQKREVRKEKLFRAELLAKIREAENFDAETYVNGVLNTIRKAPVLETKKERLDRVFNLIRENRKETVLIRPLFDDPVPEDFEKLK